MSSNLSKTLPSLTAKASPRSFGGPTSKLTSIIVNGQEYVKFTAETPLNLGAVIDAATYNAGVGLRVKAVVVDNVKRIAAGGVATAAEQATAFGKTIAQALAAGVQVTPPTVVLACALVAMIAWHPTCYALQCVPACVK